MSLITKVKAGSVSSLSDARYFSAMGVDWLGFDLNPMSAHYVSLDLYQSIAGWVTGPRRVIELPHDISADSLAQLIEAYRPDVIEAEVHQVELVQHATNIPIALHVDLDENPLWDSPSLVVEYLLVNTKSPLSVRQLLERISKSSPVLVAIAPGTSYVKEWLNNLPIVGISLQGSIETKVGEKEYPFADLLESLEEN